MSVELEEFRHVEAELRRVLGVMPRTDEERSLGSECFLPTVLAGAWGRDILAAFRANHHAVCRDALAIVDLHLHEPVSQAALLPTALATGLLESIWNPATNEERRTFTGLCGPKAKAYLRAWDAVWGVEWDGENGPR